MSTQGDAPLLNLVHRLHFPVVRFGLEGLTELELRVVNETNGDRLAALNGHLVQAAHSRLEVREYQGACDREWALTIRQEGRQLHVL